MPKAKQLFLAALLISSAILYADVTLPAIFGDHMVLQQNENVAVWGWADPGEKVSVKGSWKWLKKTSKADKNGKWKVKIRTPKTGKPGVLTIKGENEIILNDILFGEVWICSGQSNMQWTMQNLGTDRGNADIKKANHPNIRLFTVKRTVSATPKEDVEGQWQICSPGSVKDFSATGYYFGKNLHENLDVPIGLVSTNWGGTRAESWTSRDALEVFEQFGEALKKLRDPQKSEAEIEADFRQQFKEWENKIAENDKGIQEKWYAADFDDSGWKEANLPSVWSGTELAGVDGIVWYRRTTNLPPSWARSDLELHLGAIDDIASVWVNGTALGTTFGSNQKRVYQIPKTILRTGENALAIRVIDTGGEGGFSGVKDDMRIGPKGADIKVCSAVAGSWRYQPGHKGAIAAAPVKQPQINADSTPTCLFNGMIAPLLNVRIAGAIWYQGESNCYDPILYRTLFPAMIEDWRQQWDQGDFPFYYVQIAPFQYNPNTHSHALREAQMMTLDAVDNVGMAVTMDIGEQRDIHPQNKHDVGDRLARWALAKTYGYGINKMPYSGPIYESMGIKDGKIALVFKYNHSGLVAKDGTLSDFMIAGADRKFVPAKAEIKMSSKTIGKSTVEEHYLVVWSDEVPEPVAVRYGWSNWVDGSLFNGAGLPASSFRTDDWPLK